MKEIGNPMGKERTLKSDTHDKEELMLYLKDFSNEISGYLIRGNLEGKTIQ